jgi:hypothetical protein
MTKRKRVDSPEAGQAVSQSVNQIQQAAQDNGQAALHGEREEGEDSHTQPVQVALLSFARGCDACSVCVLCSCDCGCCCRSPLKIQISQSAGRTEANRQGDKYTEQQTSRAHFLSLSRTLLFSSACPSSPPICGSADRLTDSTDRAPLTY